MAFLITILNLQSHSRDDNIFKRKVNLATIEQYFGHYRVFNFSPARLLSLVTLLLKAGDCLLKDIGQMKGSASSNVI